MPLHRSTVDDRARAVPLCGVTGDPSRWVHSGNVPPALQERIAKRARSLARAKARTPAASVFVYIIGVLGVAYAAHQLAEPHRESVYAAAAVAMAMVLVFAIFRSMRRRAATNPFMVTAFLMEPRCPSCGYDLVGGEPAEDGCTVCPECGAAWRLTRAATPPGQAAPE